jgi:uncharacterized protein YecE (DUF72 family)
VKEYEIILDGSSSKWRASAANTVFGRVHEYGDTKEEALKALMQKIEELMEEAKDLFCEVHNRWLEENE